jgi:16S rRNA (uracil1498-N3)-methyltransferase
MELFYTHPNHIDNTSAEFDRFETQHILKTLRKKKGDLIRFTDGRGRLYEGVIEKVRPVLQVHHSLLRETAAPAVSVTLAVGFIRHTRMDFIIEKGTELGVQKFYLLATLHGNYLTTNTLRWQKIARQAIKQSLRLFLPTIEVIHSLTDLIPLLPPSAFKIVLDQSAEAPLSAILYRSGWFASTNIVFLIGAEGGLSSTELEFLRRQDFHFLSLGKYRLRSETAALVAATTGLYIKSSN